MSVYLIGYRGSGKSTVARHLALLLGWDWADADVEIELRAGKSIAAIFAEDGEPAFRDLESQIIEELTCREKLVLACGGGAVLRPENRRALRTAGPVVWLRAEPGTILRRISADATTAQRRPPLTAVGGEAEIIQLLAQRSPIYRQCADLEVDTEDKPPAEVAAEILRRLELLPPEPA